MRAFLIVVAGMVCSRAFGLHRMNAFPSWIPTSTAADVLFVSSLKFQNITELRMTFVSHDGLWALPRSLPNPTWSSTRDSDALVSLPVLSTKPGISLLEFVGIDFDGGNVSSSIVTLKVYDEPNIQLSRLDCPRGFCELRIMFVNATCLLSSMLQIQIKDKTDGLYQKPTLFSKPGVESRCLPNAVTIICEVHRNGREGGLHTYTDLYSAIVGFACR